MLPLLRSAAFALLVCPAFTQAAPPATKAATRARFERSPEKLRQLIQEHMVRRPHAAISGSMSLTGMELDRILEVLEINACCTFQRHIAAKREGRPGLEVTIGKKIKAKQKRHQAIAAGLIEPDFTKALEGFEFLQVTVIDKLLHDLPTIKARVFLGKLGHDQRLQLAQLGQRRAVAFKLAAPRIRGALGGLPGGKGGFAGLGGGLGPTGAIGSGGRGAAWGFTGFGQAGGGAGVNAGGRGRGGGGRRGGVF